MMIIFKKIIENIYKMQSTQELYYCMVYYSYEELKETIDNT